MKDIKISQMMATQVFYNKLKRELVAELVGLFLCRYSSGILDKAGERGIMQLTE